MNPTNMTSSFSKWEKMRRKPLRRLNSLPQPTCLPTSIEDTTRPGEMETAFVRTDNPESETVVRDDLGRYVWLSVSPEAKRIARSGDTGRYIWDLTATPPTFLRSEGAYTRDFATCSPMVTDDGRRADPQRPREQPEHLRQPMGDPCHTTGGPARCQVHAAGTYPRLSTAFSQPTTFAAKAPVATDRPEPRYSMRWRSPVQILVQEAFDAAPEIEAVLHLQPAVPLTGIDDPFGVAT